MLKINTQYNNYLYIKNETFSSLFFMSSSIAIRSHPTLLLMLFLLLLLLFHPPMIATLKYTQNNILN